MPANPCCVRVLHNTYKHIEKKNVLQKLCSFGEPNKSRPSNEDPTVDKRVDQ